jgi:hypothetical protein
VGQLARAGNEVRVDMSFGDVRDPEPLGLGRPQVRIGVAVGIDHDGFATAGAPDEVACLSQLGIVEALEEH